jgi:hypothetical protein
MIYRFEGGVTMDEPMYTKRGNVIYQRTVEEVFDNIEAQLDDVIKAGWRIIADEIVAELPTMTADELEEMHRSLFWILWQLREAGGQKPAPTKEEA